MMGRPYRIFLAILIIILLAVNILWYGAGNNPLHWDSATHLYLSLNTYNVLSGISGESSIFKNLLEVSWYYPPFVYYLSAPFYFIFGTGKFAGFLEINFLYIILIFYVYKIAVALYDERTGFFAALFISMSPVVVSFSRDYMLDLPLATLTAVTVFVLIKSDGFKSIPYSIISGICTGFGMLTKWTFIFFIITPVIYYFYNGLNKDKKKNVILNFIIYISTTAVISLPWYLHNIIPVLTARSSEFGRSNLNFLGSLAYYVKIIPEQISLLITITFITGIILFAGKNYFLKNKFPLYWIAGTYILITLINFKLPRFSIPLLIPVTLFFVNSVCSGEKREGFKNQFLWLTGFLVLIQFIFVSFINIDTGLKLPVLETPLMYNLSPNGFNWQNEEIINVIEKDRINNKKDKAIIRVIPDENSFNNSTLRYCAALNNYPISMLGTANFPFFSDYVIIGKGALFGNNINDRFAITASMFSDTSVYSDIFTEFKRFDIGNGSEIILFKPDTGSYGKVPLDSLKGKINKSAERFLKNYLKTETGFGYNIEFDDSLSAYKGKLKSLKIYAGEVMFGDFAFNPVGVKLYNFEIELLNTEYSVKSILKYNSLILFSIGGLRINSFVLTANDLREYIELSSKNNISLNQVSFEDGNMNISGYSKELNTNFEAGLTITQKEKGNLYFKIHKFKIFKIGIPAFLLNLILDRYNPLIKGIEQIKDFKINSLKITSDKMIIE